MFKKGTSGNPGGRPNIAKLLARIEEKPEKVRDALFEMALKIARKGPKSTNDATWRFAFDWIAAHLGLKPKDVVVHEFGDGTDDARDVSELTNDELDAVIATEESQASAPDDPSLH